MLAACGSAPDYDVVIRHGTVVDGSGRAGYAADVGIVGGFVAAVGDLSGASGAEEVDATGMVVAPGFVNLHSHGRPSAAGTAVNLLGQGVTTIILNADGGGPVDLDVQLDEVAREGLAVNVGANIGFNAVWSEVMGPEDRRPGPDQLSEMRGLVERGLRAGAWGVSAGLDYKPAYFARTEEVEAVLAGLGGWRTVFTNHDRITPESGFSSFVGMRETVRIGEATGLVPLITHMKIQGHEQGTSEAVLAMMDAAAARGAYTAADAYPYLAGQTSLAALIIPGWAQEGGWEALARRLADPTLRARIVAESNEALDARFGGAQGVYLPETRTELTEVMAETGAASGGEAVVGILTRLEDSPTAILRFGAEEDLAAILRHPTTSVACDCDPTEGPASHPRSYGTFPRVLGRYVRDAGVLTLEDAIRKMSGLPAATIGMVDRGLLATGMAADVTIFDPATVIDRATFAEPTLPSEGVRDVMVNGRWAFRDGRATGERAGLPLRRADAMPARRQGTDGRREVAWGEERPEAEGGPSGPVVDVAQGPDDRQATGTVDGERLGAPGFAVERLGELTVLAGWAALTGTARVDGALRPFLLVLDGSDPEASGPGTTVVLRVGAEELVRTRSERVARFRGVGS